MHRYDSVTPEDVKRIVAEGESYSTEFKRDRGLNDTDIVNAVVCMANGDGGCYSSGSRTTVRSQESTPATVTERTPQSSERSS